MLLRNTAILGTIGLAFVVSGLSPVLAQEAVLDEITVTAQKREQDLQDVPISITAISGTNLETLAIRSFDDVLELVPGLSADSPIGQGVGNRTFGLRGIQSQSLAWLVSENTVGFYIDNTPIPLQDPRLVDLERVEVLRGPQGTLYGSSTLAGLMKLVTKKPDFENVTGHFQAEFNDVNHGETGHDMQGAINMPFSDNFAVRLSAYGEEVPGYIDWRRVDLFGIPTGQPDEEDYDSIENRGGRIAALWQVTDAFSIQGSYMYNDIELFTVGFNDAFAPSLGDSPTTLGRETGPQLTDMKLWSVEMEYAWENILLTSTTSNFENSSRTGNADATEAFGFVASPIQTTFGDYHHQRDETAHETRLTSTWDKDWNFVAGVFYNKREQDYVTRFPQIPGTVVDLSVFFGLPPGTIVSPNDPDGFIFRSDSTRLIEEQAIFGEFSYDFNDQWSASVGLRYYDFKTELFDLFGGNPIFATGVPLSGSSEEDGVVARFNVNYALNDDTMFWLTAAEGFRAGGSNFPLPQGVPTCDADIADKLGPSGFQDGYSPDTVWNYEIGMKKSWADGRVTTNIALFQMDWEGVQLVIAPLCGLNGYVDNVGDAKSNGVEFESQIAVTDTIYLGLGLAYTDSTWDGDAGPDGGSFVYAVDGSQMPDVPEFTGNIRLLWDFPINDNLTGFFNTTYSYRDDRIRFALASDTSSTVKDDYTLLSIRTGVRIGETWTVQLFGENLLDEQPSFFGRPYVAGGTEIGGLPVETSLRPRTVGISVRADF